MLSYDEAAGRIVVLETDGERRVNYFTLLGDEKERKKKEEKKRGEPHGVDFGWAKIGLILRL